MGQQKHSYTDSDRALVYAELTANQGNVKRTARATQVPVTTVRNWKTDWEKGGVPETVVAALPAVVGDFVEDASRIRDKLLIRLEEESDKGRLTGTQMLTGIGILTDKIRAYKGLDNVREHHHTVEIPAMDELQLKLGNAIQELVAAGQERERVIRDVIELEPSQYSELQPTTEE